MNNIRVIVYPAKELAGTKQLMAKFLGVEPYVDSDFYVGFRAGDMEVGLDPNAQIGPIAYVDVEDIKASIQEMIGLGATLQQDIRDVAQGLLVATVKDKNGNIFGFRQAPK